MNESTDSLGFSEKWFVLGLIDKMRHKELLKEFISGVDPNPEHYRWRIFDAFIQSKAHLTDDLMRQLYHLGEVDADFSMGQSMMVAILQRADCPKDILLQAVNSDRPILRKLAKSKT